MSGTGLAATDNRADNGNHHSDWDARTEFTAAGFDEVSREQLDKIKARTMYNMIEP